MRQPWNEWDWDYLVHYVIGLGGTAILAILPLALLPSFPFNWIVPFAMIPVMLTIFIPREKKQHEDTPLTAHQWLEALLPGVGALSAALIGLIFLL